MKKSLLPVQEGFFISSKSIKQGPEKAPVFAYSPRRERPQVFPAGFVPLTLEGREAGFQTGA